MRTRDDGGIMNIKTIARNERKLSNETAEDFGDIVNAYASKDKCPEYRSD
jgi:hypothetical protein